MWYSRAAVRILILTVFLAIVQTAPSLPRQATDSSARGGNKDNGKSNPDNDNSPNASAPPVQQEAAPKGASKANPVSGLDASQPVSIAKLPTVSVDKDWRDKTYWLMTLAIVFITGIEVFLLWKTLRAVNRQLLFTAKQTRGIMQQARQTAASVEAAKRSLEFQEILNQQWILVGGWRRHGGSSREQDPPRFRIAVNIGNPTNNPLTVIGATINAKGQTRTFSAGATLGPDETPIVIETHEVVVSAPEIAVYNAYRLPVIVVGEIVYRDVFGKDKIQTFGQLCILGPNNHFQFMPFYQMQTDEADKKKET